MENYIFLNPNTGKKIKEDGKLYNQLLLSGQNPIRLEKDKFKKGNGLYRNKIDKIFNTKGFRIIKMKKDGNCFFNAVAYATNNKMEFLRKIVSDNIDSNQYKMLKNLWESTGSVEYEYMDYVDDLQGLKEIIMEDIFWGEEISISIIQEKLNLVLILIDGITESIYTNYKENDITKYLILYYTGDHYNLVEYNGVKSFTKNNLPEAVLIKIKN